MKKILKLSIVVLVTAFSFGSVPAFASLGVPTGGVGTGR